MEDGHQRGNSCSYRLNTLNLAETHCVREYCRQVRHPHLLQAYGYRLVTHSIHYHRAWDCARAGVAGPAAHVARYDADAILLVDTFNCLPPVTPGWRYDAGAILLVDTASIQWHTHYRRYCASGYPVPGSQFPVLSSRFSVLSS